MRVDLKICQKCSQLQVQVNNGFDFMCFAKHENADDAPFKIGTMKVETDKRGRICYDPNFKLPAGCNYLTEQLFLRDAKGLIR